MRWTFTEFGSEQLITFVAMATPDDLNANAEFIRLSKPPNTEAGVETHTSNAESRPASYRERAAARNREEAVHVTPTAAG